MAARLIRAVLILPGTVAVLVPALLVWGTHGTRWAAAMPGAGAPQAWLGVALIAAGMTVVAWTGRLFAEVGKGTPAPWDPPLRLVVAGPYRHVRNPMISAVGAILAGEALVLGSWPVAVWAALFLAANMAYFPLVEEKALERRFGADYRVYRANVPRWLPRPTPWNPLKDRQD